MLTPVTTLANAIASRQVRLRLEVIDERDKAVRVIDAQGRTHWLPSRAIVNHYDGTITLPKRLAAKKGLGQDQQGQKG